MTFLTGTGAIGTKLFTFFGGRSALGLAGVGLGLGGRQRRMRTYLELPRGLWIQNFWGSRLPLLVSSASKKPGPCFCNGCLWHGAFLEKVTGSRSG